MKGGLPGDQVRRLSKPKSDQRAHGSRKRPSGQVPAPGCKTGSDPTNLPASQAARHHPTPPASPHGPEHRNYRRGNPRQPPARTRRRFHANATSPDEYGCKTVGSAYVGSNPTPATPAKTALWLRKRGPGVVSFSSRHVSGCVTVGRCVAVSTYI